MKLDVEFSNTVPIGHLDFMVCHHSTIDAINKEDKEPKSRRLKRKEKVSHECCIVATVRWERKEDRGMQDE